MSFDTIRTAAATRAKAVLTGYSELTNIFSIEDNPRNDLDKGFCVSWGEGLPGQGPLRKVAMNGRLIVTMVNAIDVRSLDDQAPSCAPIYQDIDVLIGSFFDATLLDIPASLRGMKDVSIGKPTLIYGNEYVRIDLSFNVDFLINITY
jgi:hypothetical protein